MADPNDHSAERRDDVWIKRGVAATVCVSYAVMAVVSIIKQSELTVGIVIGGVLTQMGNIVINCFPGAMVPRASKTVLGPDQSTTTVAPPAEPPP